MRTVLALMNRNRKLFFKDKGMLFTSMITPVILIVLYATFLAKVFRDSYAVHAQQIAKLYPGPKEVRLEQFIVILWLFQLLQLYLVGQIAGGNGGDKIGRAHV